MAKEFDQSTNSCGEKTELVTNMAGTPRYDDKSTRTEEVQINSNALQGFRGLAALHILVFHALLYTEGVKGNLIGSLEMPLFFLMSGYCLALAYGHTAYTTHTSCCCTSETETGCGSPVFFEPFRTINFYRNRFSRIMPMYYLSNFIFGLVPHLLAFGIAPYNDTSAVVTISLTVLDSIFPIGMILPGSMFPVVGASWTISTFWLFYLVFPVILPRLQKLPNEKLSEWTVLLFWTQIIVGILLFVGLSPLQLPILPGSCVGTLHGYCVGISAYWISSGWGLSRLPVFFMGLLAGLKRLRHSGNAEMIRQNQIINFINAWIPFRVKREKDVENSARKWEVLINVISTVHVAIIITAALLGLITSQIPNNINWGIQRLTVHSFLFIIDGLTRDEGRSIVSRICNFRLTQELGRASMTLYLIHEPVLKWVGYAIKKWRKEPIEERYMKAIQKKFVTPFWGTLAVVLVTPFLAWVLTKWIEEPLRKKLRKR